MISSRSSLGYPLSGTLVAAIGVLAFGGCTSTGGEPVADPAVLSGNLELTVVPYRDVDWGALNPARGAAGPGAADLWGDRTADGATGFLVRFAEGFSSPPHIHNTTYRGVVIEGLVHNDDPDAAESWMPPGSYWTQPAGEVHITSAKGEGRVAYIEIQSGPYLVMPPEQASDNGERAINVHAGNLVWLDASTSRQVSIPQSVAPEDGPRIAFLWGDPQDDQPGGVMVELPADRTATLSVASGDLRAVVISGSGEVRATGGVIYEGLGGGSFVGASGDDGSAVTWSATSPTWLYVRTSGPINVSMN